MTILYWTFIGIVVISALFGLKSLLMFVFGTWAENGGKFALLFGIFIILLIAPGIIKFTHPEYYGISIWVFILYSLGLIAYKNLKRNTHKEG